jgi:rhamnosyltransferase
MLTKRDICAVMVSYNCDSSIVENIEALLDQVEQVLIVDNGSNTRSLSIIKTQIDNNRVEVIYNQKNMGIAFALNQGLNYAKNNNYKLLLTMDQDSTLCNHSVQKMLNVLNSNPKIVSVGPNYNSICPLNDLQEYKLVDYLITSGNLTYVEKAHEINGYNNELFIDGVDFDFSLSLRNKELNLALVYEAYMNHNLGTDEERNFVFFKLKINTHSPLRHYYMFRNHYYIIKKFFLTTPKFCIKKEINLWIYFWKVLLLQPAKKNNLGMILKGIYDSVRRRKYGEF